jgi:hypothetical protein
MASPLEAGFHIFGEFSLPAKNPDYSQGLKPRLQFFARLLGFPNRRQPKPKFMLSVAKNMESPLAYARGSAVSYYWNRVRHE